MQINCACPKCGKQTTEYQEDKWTCLYCGNKFVIVEDAPTIFNSSININGKALYDLDVQNKKEFARGEKLEVMGWEEKSFFSVPRRIRWITYSNCYVIAFLFCMLGMCGNSNDNADIKEKFLSSFFTAHILAGFIFVLVYRFCVWKGIWNNHKPIYGKMPTMNSYCPYCSRLFGQQIGYENLRNDWDLGLVHCHKCGKLFAIQNGVSYQISS